MENAKRLDNVLEFIIKFKTENDGNSPTFREIMAGVGLSSTSEVKYWLERLVAQGRIEFPLKNQSRFIIIVGSKGWSN